MKILVTGGLGYIGSHTCVELLDAGYDIVVVDNLYNSDISVKDRIEKITGKTFKFYENDVCDEDALEKLVYNGDFDITKLEKAKIVKPVTTLRVVKKK